MNLMKTAAMIAVCTSLAACAGNPFGRNGPDDGATGVAAGLGSASDPTSIAYFQTSVGDRVLFAVDQSTLSADAITTLNAQANWLSSNGSYAVVIEGHADEQGTREYNLALGDRRAQAVRDHLVARGIAPGRISTITFGKERPIEICSTEACWSQNRRAVTAVKTGLSG